MTLFQPRTFSPRSIWCVGSYLEMAWICSCLCLPYNAAYTWRARHRLASLVLNKYDDDSLSTSAHLLMHCHRFHFLFSSFHYYYYSQQLRTRYGYSIHRCYADIVMLMPYCATIAMMEMCWNYFPIFHSAIIRINSRVFFPRDFSLHSRDAHLQFFMYHVMFWFKTHQFPNARNEINWIMKDALMFN